MERVAAQERTFHYEGLFRGLYGNWIKLIRLLE
jgi:hypothetical protein